MGEVNLLAKLPKPKRSVQSRRTAKTPEIIETSRQFGELHFDGPREYGYGGLRSPGRRGWRAAANAGGPPGPGRARPRLPPPAPGARATRALPLGRRRQR